MRVISDVLEREREREVKCGEKSAKKVMKSRKKRRKENQSFFLRI